MVEEQIVLVDQNDRELGFMPKLEVHQKGLLHRAFSVFVFNEKGEMLIQQRALDKYHSPGLWTNTCCSHPRWKEDTEEAAHRRLKEEMGFDCPLNYVFHFLYRADLENELIEHELDHVYRGVYTKDPKPNREEVADFRWIGEQELKYELENQAEKFTYWFKEIMLKYHGEITFPKI